MRTVYADESGIHQGSRILVIGSYIGEADIWEKAEAAIVRANNRAGCLSHAVDCAHLQGDFAGMDRDKAQRYYRKMLAIINRYPLVGMSAAIYLDDFGKVFGKSGPWNKWIKKPYALCFKQYLVELCQHFAEHYPGEQITIAMEDNRDLYPVAAGIFLDFKKHLTWPNHALLNWNFLFQL
jgi:hypothetical protein